MQHLFNLKNSTEPRNHSRIFHAIILIHRFEKSLDKLRRNCFGLQEAALSRRLMPPDTWFVGFEEFEIFCRRSAPSRRATSECSVRLFSFILRVIISPAAITTVVIKVQKSCWRFEKFPVLTRPSQPLDQNSRLQFKVGAGDLSSPSLG